MGLRQLKIHHFILLSLFITVANGLPFLAADYVPLWDWPAHLSRAYVIRNIQDNGDLGVFYNLHSWLMPNIASDLGLVWLMSWFDPYTAGRLFVYVTILLTMFGVGLTSYALNRRLLAIPLLLSAVLAFNGILLWGFINYLFGIALVLCGIGTWILLERFSFTSRVAIGCLISTIIFFAHLAAFGIYALTIFSYSFQAFLLARKSTGKNDVSGIIIAALNIIPLVAIFLALSPMKSGASLIQYPTLSIKMEGLIQGLITYNLFADILFFSVIFLVLIIAVRHWRDYISLDRPLLFPIVSLVFVYLVAPHILIGSAFFESRLPIAILLMFVSSLKDDFVAYRYKYVIVIFLSITIFVRSILLTSDWRNYNGHYQAFNSCFNSLPEGAVMGVVRSIGSNDSASRLRRWQPPVEWVASYATIERHIFIPQMFAQLAQQPITVKEPYIRLYKTYGNSIEKVKNFAELEKYINNFSREFLLTQRNNKPKNLLLLVLIDRNDRQEASYSEEIICHGNGFYVLDLLKGMNK
jgi:hypothetical protein